MAVRRIKNHGKWVWQARASYRGRRRAAAFLIKAALERASRRIAVTREMP